MICCTFLGLSQPWGLAEELSRQRVGEGGKKGQSSVNLGLMSALSIGIYWYPLPRTNGHTVQGLPLNWPGHQ